MKAPSTMALLKLWESGLNQPMLQKTLNLLSSVCSEFNTEDIAKMSIGERDARLFLLRERLFGSRLYNMADCPKCGEGLEWENDVADIRLQVPQDAPLSKNHLFENGGYRVHFRLPNSIDISVLLEKKGERADSKALLSRCIVSGHHHGKACSFADLPEPMLEALSKRIEAADPQADIRIVLNCPDCRHQWESPFDIVSFLWEEIDRWAERVMRSVHKLASAYHWSEEEILKMSPLRRELYLGMVN